MWGAAGIAASWKASQLLRIPSDRGLRVVTICTLLVFIALSAQVLVTLPGLTTDVTGQPSKLIQNVVLTFFFTLLIVLLQSTQPRSTPGTRRGYVQIGLALATSAALTIAYLASAGPVRGASYSAAVGHPGVLAFYWIGNVYMLYTTGYGAYLARSAAGQIRSRARWGLYLAGAGLLICCLGAHLPRVLSTTGQLVAKIELIPGTATWTAPALALGVATFFLGVGYPGARTGLVKARLWFQTRRSYRQLRPLWTALHRQFPTIALFPPFGPAREALAIRHMRLRYYRRVVECRDGLVSLSPYIAEPVDGSHCIARQAELVHDALSRCATGHQIGTGTVIAPPVSPGMDADTHELLALSRSFARLEDASDVQDTQHAPG